MTNFQRFLQRLEEKIDGMTNFQRFLQWLEEKINGTWVLVGLFVVFMWYIWATDTTRQTHPDYKRDSEGCQQVANIIYSEALDRALSDPYNTWQIHGDRNAYEYAERSRGIALSGCTL